MGTITARRSLLGGITAAALLAIGLPLAGTATPASAATGGIAPSCQTATRDGQGQQLRCTQTWTSGVAYFNTTLMGTKSAVDFTVVGAEGGDAIDGTKGGRGGKVSTLVTLPDGYAAFKVSIAGRGMNAQDGGQGGWGGGGDGGVGRGGGAVANTRYGDVIGGGGGGASVVTANYIGWKAGGSNDSIVAVGPGGGGASRYGGNGANAGWNNAGGFLRAGSTTDRDAHSSADAGWSASRTDANSAGKGGFPGGHAGTSLQGGSGFSLPQSCSNKVSCLVEAGGVGGGGGGAGYMGGGGGGQTPTVGNAITGFKPAGAGGGSGNSNGLEVTPTSDAPSVTAAWWLDDVTTTTTLSLSSTSISTDKTVTATATVTPSIESATPIGTVQFTVDGQPYGRPLSVSKGYATVSTAIGALSAGTHSVAATFTPAGLSGIKASPISAARSLIVTPVKATSTPITLTKGDSSNADSTVLNVSLPKGATGMVTWRWNGEDIASTAVQADGTSTYRTNPKWDLPNGTFTAYYAGDANWPAATSSAVVVP